MKSFTALLVTCCSLTFLLTASLASGQECGPSGACCDVDSMFGPCGGSGCFSDLCSRQTLLGDALGLRPAMMQNGLIYQGSLTQFYQGVASGGARQQFKYGGMLDQFFILSGAPYGNEGFSAIMHAQTRYGQDVNFLGGTASPPNIAMLYPNPGSDETAITGLILQQALSERIVVSAGKYQAVDLTDMLIHNGRGIEGFMNTSLALLPLTLARTTNLSFMGAGINVLHGKEVQGGVMVYDTNNAATTSGFNNLFNNGAVVLGFWREFTEFGGLPGYQMVGGNYSSGNYTSTQRDSFSFVPGQGIVSSPVKGSWSLFYAGSQQLWADSAHPERNWELRGQLSLADDNPNFMRWVATAMIEGKGVIPGRELDRMGAGYFFVNLSGNFKNLVSPVASLQDLHGVELYYNYAVTPWFRVSADLQVIDGVASRLNTAVIPGLRAQLVY